MAQVTSNTPSITSRYGTEHVNDPVRLDNTLRFVCDVTTTIGDCDTTQYPAIRFDLANKERSVQYWIYTDEALRDADCAALTAAATPPESDYLAFWDTTGDNLPDTDPTANPQPGGVWQATQLYFDETGVPNAMPVPFDGIIEMRRLGTPYVLADLDAANGSSLASAANWSGPFANDVAMNMAGTVGHTSSMQFNKATFAQTFGQTYSKARAITMRIIARKNGLLSGNTGNLLSLPVALNAGQLRFPNDIDVSFFGTKQGTVLHVGLFEAENTINQGVQDIQISTDRWSKKRMISDVQNIVLQGTHCRYYDDVDSATGRSCIFSKESDRSKIWRIHVVGFDADNFPIYDANAVDVNGAGLPGASLTAASQFAVSEKLTANQMPVILLCKGTATGLTCSILVNSTDAASPDYATFLETTSIDATLFAMIRPRGDADGRFYTSHGFGTRFFSRLIFAGSNNNASDLLNASNWSRDPMAVPVALTPALNGDGSVMQGSFDGCAINEDLIINGEPVIYVTDPTNFVVWQCSRNTNSFGDERDWTWTVIIGQSGVQGGADGIGTAATIGAARSCVYKDGFLYICIRNRHTIRRYNTTTSEVDTIFGIDLSAGDTQQFNY